MGLFPKMAFRGRVCNISSIISVCLPRTACTNFFFTTQTMLNNPQRTCAARITVLGLCVCLSVDYYSRAISYNAAYEQQRKCYKHLEN